MSRLVLVVLAILAVGGYAEPLKYLSTRLFAPRKVADKQFLLKESELLSLFNYIYQPCHTPDCLKISSTWSLENNMDKYKNTTAVKIYIDLMQNKWLLPRELPFSVLNPQHLFEAKTLYNVFYSSKDYDTFYKTAVYMRDRVNQKLYVYVLSIAILNYPETKGIKIPSLYEIFPSYFYNSQVLTTTHRIKTHGKSTVQKYPGTFLWGNNIVIKWNETAWPYYSEELTLSYFTNDYNLNNVYYNNHIINPFWLTGDEGPTSKLNRGEYYWFLHKQLLAHYYMERLSNGFGEIPELDYEMVYKGYVSGLSYHNGITYPDRPNYFKLNQPMFTDYISMIKDVEGRIRSAIDLGYVINENGEHISIKTPESINLLGKLIEGNVDSPNVEYYKDIVNLWRILLGNSLKPAVEYVNGYIPLVVPSALEQYQTALRDPAFYMIWKHIMKIFNTWSSYLPPYKFEELALPSVKIISTQVDKIVTYFENGYTNVTNALYLNEEEAKSMTGDTSVLVLKPVLNHKTYLMFIHVTSEVTQFVNIRLFLAPKYDSKGIEIPLHENTQNFFQLDQFACDMAPGNNIVIYLSNQNAYITDNWNAATEIYQKASKAYNGTKQSVLDETELYVDYPHHLKIPKGRVGGMPFVLMVYIDEHPAHEDPNATSSKRSKNFVQETGFCYKTNNTLGYPLDRPLYEYQVKNLGNMFFQDVEISHTLTPEINYLFAK